MTVCCTHFHTPFLSYPLLKPAAHGQPGLAAEGTVVVHRQTIRCQDQRDLAILAENGNNLLELFLPRRVISFCLSSQPH